MGYGYDTAKLLQEIQKLKAELARERDALATLRLSHDTLGESYRELQDENSTERAARETAERERDEAREMLGAQRSLTDDALILVKIAQARAAAAEAALAEAREELAEALRAWRFALHGKDHGCARCVDTDALLARLASERR